ncbi:hypothetical protein ACEPAF_5800 [Sanghuangporus sanghuang]
MANDDLGQESDTNRVGTGDPWDFDNPLLAANYADNLDQEYRCDSSVVSYNVASILQCYPTLVTLGYTGPWFKKIGMKIQPQYLESNVDLDELVQWFKKYLKELKKKCKVNSAGEIVLMNINNEQKGSKRSGSVLQNATKPTSAAEATKGDLNAMLAPHIKEIKQNLWCSTHLEEVCYVRADGTYIYYTMKNYFDHARLLLSKAPGMTALEVPKQLNLLNYHKSK